MKFRVKLTMLVETGEQRERRGAGVLDAHRQQKWRRLVKLARGFFSSSQPGQFGSVFAFSRCRLLHTFIVLINHIRSARNMENIFHSSCTYVSICIRYYKMCIVVYAAIRYRTKLHQKRGFQKSFFSAFIFLLSWHDDFSLKLITNSESVCLLLLSAYYLNTLMNFHFLYWLQSKIRNNAIIVSVITGRKKKSYMNKNSIFVNNRI